MGHHKPAYGQRSETNATHPSIGASDKQGQSNGAQQKSKADMNPPEPRWLGLTRFERIMAVLTFFGLVIAGLTGGIFWLQLGEMRTDERAWISMSTPTNYPPQFPKNRESVDITGVSTTVTVTNGGKTAAREVYSQVVMEYVINGSDPEFIYDGRARSTNLAGIMFPNQTAQFPAPFSKGVPNSPTVVGRLLTPGEYDDLGNGNAYLAVYAEVTYLDIFNTKHWLHYCAFFTNPATTPNVTVTARKCVSYNNTDNN